MWNWMECAMFEKVFLVAKTNHNMKYYEQPVCDNFEENIFSATEFRNFLLCTQCANKQQTDGTSADRNFSKLGEYWNFRDLKMFVFVLVHYKTDVQTIRIVSFFFMIWMHNLFASSAVNKTKYEVFPTVDAFFLLFRLIRQMSTHNSRHIDIHMRTNLKMLHCNRWNNNRVSQNVTFLGLWLDKQPYEVWRNKWNKKK